MRFLHEPGSRRHIGRRAAIAKTEIRRRQSTPAALDAGRRRLDAPGHFVHLAGEAGFERLVFARHFLAGPRHFVEPGVEFGDPPLGLDQLSSTAMPAITVRRVSPISPKSPLKPVDHAVEAGGERQKMRSPALPRRPCGICGR